MKKSIKNILIILLAITAVFCGVFGFSACGDDSAKLEKLSIETPKTVFRVGDTFEYGDDFKVLAVYSDGTTKDVTGDVGFRYESGFDANAPLVPGNYQITVSYENKREVYTIYVGDFENILRSLDLDTSNVKKTYVIGEAVSFEGIKITSNYENAQGVIISETVSSLKEFNVTVTSPSGETVNNEMLEFGDYTVTVAKGLIKANYTVTVEGIDISTVSGAIAVGKAFKKEVKTGTQKTEAATRFSNYNFYTEYNYEYEFGNNYTYVKESQETNHTYHFGMDEEGFFAVELEGTRIVTGSTLSADNMDGTQIMLWYYFQKVYGIENTISVLYDAALNCSNNDLEETANETAREYSFKFSGLQLRSNNSDFFKTTVNFQLGPKNNIEKATIIEDYYENNSQHEGNEGYVPTFITGTDGKTRPNVENPSQTTKFTVNQTAGERTAENPYNRHMFEIQSYNLNIDGDLYTEDEVVIDCKVGDEIYINMTQISPATANLSQDLVSVNYEGSHESDNHSMVWFDGFYANLQNTRITVQLRNGGKWTLIIKTKNTTKKVTFNVTGVAPESMTGLIRNDVTGNFSAGTSKLIAIGGKVYFYAGVNKYANPAQTATITSGSQSDAVCEKAEIAGVSCFKFSATKEGNYTVVVRSDADSSKFVTFTFTVSEMPDYASLLQGKYSCKDLTDGVYVLTFSPEESGATNGTLTVVYTPADVESGELLPDEAKTQNFTYTVEDNTIRITPVSGTNLGIMLKVNASGKLVLNDPRDRDIILTVVTD